MAPSAGHVHSYVVRNLRVLRSAWKSARQALQARIAEPSLRPQLQAVPVRSGQPIHPVAYLKQLKGRFYSTSTRSFSTSSSAPKGVRYLKSSFPQSRTATFVAASTGRAPFASTLRPNLTGGTLGRTAGGYSLGSGRVGGARFFSHGPAAPAEVVQNVSQAVRAFMLSGQKAHYNGIDATTGEKRFRAVTAVQDKAICRALTLPQATPGSYIDFALNPSITAFTSLQSLARSTATESYSAYPTTLNTDGLLDILSVDFSRALKDLAATLNDLKRLAALGDLPISHPTPSTLRIHFPGCDAETAERVCAELGVQRGLIAQDPDFDAYMGAELALLFPCAPSAPPSENAPDYNEMDYNELFTPAPRRHAPAVPWADMISRTTSPRFSTKSATSADEHWDDVLDDSPSGYETLSSGRARSSERGDVLLPLEMQSNRALVQFIALLDASKR